MDIQVGAVSRQAIHIRTGTALQGQLHEAIRRQPGFAGHFRVEGDGRVSFDSDEVATRAAATVGPRSQRDLAVIRSAHGRYYIEPLVENLQARGRAGKDLYVATETLNADGHVGAELTRLVLAASPEALSVRFP